MSRAGVAVWAAAVTLVILAGAPIAFGMRHQKAIGDGWPVSDFSGVLGLVTIAVWFASWAISGRGSSARVALALLPCWALLELSGTPAKGVSDQSTWSLATALASLTAVSLLNRARHSPDVDTELRPFRALLVIASGIALTITSLLLVMRWIGDLPFSVTVSAGVLAIGAWCFAAQMCRSSQRLETRARYYIGLGFLCFAVGSCDLTVGRLDPTSDFGLWSFTCGRAALLFGWCLVLTVAIRSLDAARRVAGRRDYSLRFARDEVLDRFTERQRQLDERRHDLRSLIAGIQDATSTLMRYRELLDRSEQHELEAALLAEVSRLRRSIDTAEPSNTFNLPQAIGPMITAERSRGASMNVDLVDVELCGNGDEVAALAQNLVTNSHHHAAGASISIVAEVVEGHVWLTIGDDGPGLPAAIRDRVEALLAGEIAQESVSVGQAIDSKPRSGLGLGICARIAREQGIELRLLEHSRGCYFTMQIALAAAREPAHSGSRV
jgi:signal transduction histidine kinase